MTGAIWAGRPEFYSDNLSKLWVMDPSEIPERLARADKRQSELARYLGMDPSSLTRTIKGRRKLTAVEATKIEAFFSHDGPMSADATVHHLSEVRVRGQRRIPVYGYAAAGGGAEDRVAINGGQVLDWIDPPPFWSGAGELIAVRIIGVSEEPRFFEGELAIAQIGLRPGRGRDCLVEFHDGSAIVKTYMGTRDARVFLKQWNPEKQIDFAYDQVKAIHEIIWRK